MTFGQDGPLEEVRATRRRSDQNEIGNGRHMVCSFVSSLLGARAAVAMLAMVTAASASEGACAGTPPCPGAGTVNAQHQIGQYVGGFGGGLDAGDRFGESVAIVGDVDGDGIDELAVGAPGDDDGGSGRGATWILFMNSDGSVRQRQKISATEGGFSGPLGDGVTFGSSLAELGDLDGDGVPDLAVGAYNSDTGGTDRGAVWILFLNTDGTVKGSQQISSGMGGFGGTLSNSDLFGIDVEPIGDIDDDGLTEIAVGAIGDDTGGADRGAVWILFLNPDGTVKHHRKIAQGVGGFTGPLANGDNFGISTASIGDLDGDGFTDLAVGARWDDAGGSNRGALWILFLNPDGTVKSQQRIAHGVGGFVGPLANNDWFGSGCSSVGDIDGDGFGDIAVGAIEDDDGGPNRGAVWVLLMRPDGTVKAQQKVSQSSGGFAGSLSNQGHFGEDITLHPVESADGRLRVFVGASSNNFMDNSGEIWLMTLDTCTMGPEIIVHPDSVLLDIGGGTARLSVAAEGSGSLLYQWRKDGVPLSDDDVYGGVARATLTISNARNAHIGLYDCVVSNALGSTATSAAVVGIRQVTDIETCFGDLDGDGSVTGADLGGLLGAWGPCLP